MSLSLKAGVSVRKLQPQALLILVVAEGVWRDHGVPGCVMTSGDDPGHMEGSRHYPGFAVDLRLVGLPEALQIQLVDTLRARLGKQYDVVREVKKGIPHCHAEFDPKDEATLGVRA